MLRQRMITFVPVTQHCGAEWAPAHVLPVQGVEASLGKVCRLDEGHCPLSKGGESCRLRPEVRLNFTAGLVGRERWVRGCWRRRRFRHTLLGSVVKNRRCCFPLPRHRRHLGRRRCGKIGREIWRSSGCESTGPRRRLDQLYQVREAQGRRQVQESVDHQV